MKIIGRRTYKCCAATEMMAFMAARVELRIIVSETRRKRERCWDGLSSIPLRPTSPSDLQPLGHHSVDRGAGLPKGFLNSTAKIVFASLAICLARFKLNEPNAQAEDSGRKDRGRTNLRFISRGWGGGEMAGKTTRPAPCERMRLRWLRKGEALFYFWQNEGVQNFSWLENNNKKKSNEIRSQAMNLSRSPWR